MVGWQLPLLELGSLLEMGPRCNLPPPPPPPPMGSHHHNGSAGVWSPRVCFLGPLG